VKAQSLREIYNFNPKGARAAEGGEGMNFNDMSYGLWAFWILQIASIFILLSIDKKMGRILDVMEKKDSKEEKKS
jgi:hypothetical protein